MTSEDMEAAIKAVHDPEGSKENHVYSVWEDGEITLEKGGELFGRRTLHTLEFGDRTRAWPVSIFPVTNIDNAHGRVFCKSWEHARSFSDLIRLPDEETRLHREHMEVFFKGRGH